MSTLKVILVTTLLSISVLFAKSQCNYSIVLNDTYGDGWDAASVSVTVGTTTYGPYTLASGFGPETFNFPVTAGSQIHVTYTPGSWPQENEYYIYNSGGSQIFHDGPNPTASNTLVGTASCPTCISPTAQTATSVTLNSAILGWTSTGSLWNIQYGIAGFTLGSGTMINGLTSNSYSQIGRAHV